MCVGGSGLGSLPMCLRHVACLLTFLFSCGVKNTLLVHMLTGESRPVGKAFGSEVISGTVNGSGSLLVRESIMLHQLSLTKPLAARQYVFHGIKAHHTP